MPMNIISWLDQRKHWWKVFLLIMVVSVCVVGRIGYNTYQSAPPLCNFVDEEGNLVFAAQDIAGGKAVFLDKLLMDYGSFLGDGGMRGPDFTAEALYRTALYMNEFYKDDEQTQRLAPEYQKSFVKNRVQDELKKNRYDTKYYSVARKTTEGPYAAGAVVMSPAQVHAFKQVREYYRQKFDEGGDLVGPETFPIPKYITEPEKIDNVAAFFYWGGWLCAAERPGGYKYSYTHNWPYDPLAGNQTHGGLILWSVIGSLVVFLTIGTIFYYYGKMDREAVLEQQQSQLPPFATSDQVDKYKPTPTQRAMYKFFAVAAILFLIQVLAGFLTISDFVGVFKTYGIELDKWIPVTVSRAWHTQISVLWIAVCWFASTIWVLPLICRPEPRGQLAWINTLFWMLVVVALGGAAGLEMGALGILGEGWPQQWLGIGGWEFLQIAFFYHCLLYAAFVVWLIIVVRGLWPALKQKQSWSLPNWIVYAISGIIFMFTASFMTNNANFAIADFWRWCTVHMWVEAFFELFTTIIVAYFLYLMGFVSHRVAARVVYLGAVLFLGSGLIGISHNFYWNAKSMETIALGAAFSSLQVAPLILLTIEAWRFRKMPESTLYQLNQQAGPGSKLSFGLDAAFLFLVGVNFWNFIGAGVLGFMLNLPIVNYYQHGTYLTVNHAHAALFGVYGNLAIAAMLFCGRWNIGPSRWNPGLLKCAFWSMNIGLVLMMFMDLFPVGVHQLIVSMGEQGYAFARSNEYLEGTVFQTYTWARAPGVALFFFGGVLPLVWFMVSRWFSLKPVQTLAEQFVVPASVLAFAGPADEVGGSGGVAARLAGPKPPEDEEGDELDASVR